MAHLATLDDADVLIRTRMNDNAADQTLCVPADLYRREARHITQAEMKKNSRCR